MNTSLPQGKYQELLALALRGFTAVTISEMLDIDVVVVSELMPTSDERKEMRMANKINN